MKCRRKLWQVWVLTALLICSMSLPVFAQGVPSTGDNDVKATYIGSFTNSYVEKADEDSVIPLPDGDTITIDGDPRLPEDYRVVITVVDVVTQTEAWRYISDQFPKKDLYIMSVSFYKGNTKVDTMPYPVKIGFSVPQGMQGADAWALTAGVKSSIQTEVSAGAVCSLELTKESFLVLAKTQAGEIKVEMITDGKAPETTMENSLEELRDMVLTEEDKKRVEAGENVHIYLEVKDVSDQVSTEEKQLVEGKKGDYTIGMYLDVSLFKQVGTDDPNRITETNGIIKISFKIPENLLNTDNSVTRTYQIIRVHEGVAEILNCTYDEKEGTLSFETNLFSTYALTYKDTEKTTEPTTEPTTKPTTEPTKPTTDPTNSTTEDKHTASNPATGDTTNSVLWLSIMLLSGGAVMLLLARRRHLGKEMVSGKEHKKEDKE